MDLTQKITGLKLSKTVTVRPYKGAEEFKTIHLEVDYEGLTNGDVMAKALKSDVIDWQNGSGGRKIYDQLVDHGTVEIKASSPGSAPQLDMETAMVAKLQAMSPEEQEEYLKTMLIKAKK